MTKMKAVAGVAVCAMSFPDRTTAFVQQCSLAPCSRKTSAGNNMLIAPHQQRRARPLWATAATVSMTGETVDGGESDLPRVLCHGEILFDCIATPEAAGWDLEKVEESGAWKAYPGGAPANVACALVKLGVPASFVGAVGRDKEGDELLQVLESCGVKTELASRVDGYPTRTVMVTRDVNGDRTFAGFGNRRPSDAFADCHNRLSETEDAVRGLLQPGSWLVQGTLGLAYPGSFESHVCLAKWAKEAGAVRFLDINWRPVFWELAVAEEGEMEGPSDYEDLARERISAFSQTADVIKLTDEEAEWLCGIPGDEAFRDPACLRSYFPAAQAILVTAGANGAAYSVGGLTGSVPVFKTVDVVETTGAGDAFSAGFISEAIKHLSASPPPPPPPPSLPSSPPPDPAAMPLLGLEEIGTGAGGAVEREGVRGVVRFASAVGALTCCGDGAIKPQPAYEDVLGLLRQEKN